MAFTSILTLLAVLLLVGGVLVSCQYPNLSRERVAEFEEAQRLAGGSGPVPGSQAEQEAIARVKDFLSTLSPESVKTKTSLVYAEDAYFNDTLKTLHGAEAIEEYLLKTAETVNSIEVVFEDVARSGPDFYFRWRMDFEAPKLRGGDTLRSIGMTQIRFDADGKVAMHQDYWDSMAGLFEHLPVTNQMAGFVRKRL